MSAELLGEIAEATIPAANMEIGQLGIYKDARGGDEMQGQILLRTFSTVVSLTSPRITWGVNLGTPLVKPLPKGTEVKYKSEF